MNLPDIKDILNSPYAWVGALGILLATFQALQIGPLLRWLVNRHKEDLAFVNTQLNDAKDLSDEMKLRLKSERDSLLLFVTARVSVNAPLGKALVAISEDHPHGIKWSELQRACRHLALNDEGNVIVVPIGNWTRVKGWLRAALWPVCELVYVAGVYAAIIVVSRSTGTAASKLALFLGYMVIAFFYLAAAEWTREPLLSIRAADRVRKKLDDMKTRAHKTPSP